MLGLLYGHPDQDFYLRQIVRAVAGGHGAVQRELKQLSDAEIVRRFLRGSQVYFQANAECPIFQELKAIIVKTVGVADVLRTALAPLGESDPHRFHLRLDGSGGAKGGQRRGRTAGGRRGVWRGRGCAG